MGLFNAADTTAKTGGALFALVRRSWGPRSMFSGDLNRCLPDFAQ